MTATGVDDVVGTWEGASVDVAAIEKALAQLWYGAGQQGAGGTRQPPPRSCVMNLVVYVSREEDMASVTDMIGSLSQGHPSRTIIVVADPGAPTSSLDASATAQCRVANSTHGRLCWEQVMIKAHGATAMHAPGVVIPLLLPDLPTYLWWSGDAPFSTDLFQRMVNLCDRLIVDSARFARPIDGLTKLAAISRNTADDRGVSDFHWMRLTPWRNLMAQFYDRDELRPYAERIETVRIEYARTGEVGSAAQALLLAGWLGSRLGWSARPHAARLQDAAPHLEAGRGGATVSIDIVPRAPIGADPGDLVSVTMTAMLRDIPASFSIERRAEDAEATTTTKLDGAAGVAHTVRMATRSPGELLAEELEMFRHDRVYEDALYTAVEMCGRLAAEETP